MMNFIFKENNDSYLWALKRPRNNHNPAAIHAPSTQSVICKYQDSSGEEALGTTEMGNSKTGLEHIVIPGSEEAIKDYWGHIRMTQPG